MSPPRPAPRRPAAARRSARATAGEAGYTAKHIEVLEGLEPVRRRPGMYIGGTDEKALHHLFAEVIDNSMDEALAGHADWIEVEMAADGFVTVTDNGRGIPVDPHPKFKNKSALEVIMCTLHAGGKFDSEVYETSGGLHGVGVSVANALSERMEVEVARGQKLYRMAFERGKPKTQIAGRRQGAEPARHQSALPAGPGDFRRQCRALSRERAVQDDALEGLSVRRRRNPLVAAPRSCCTASKTCRNRRRFISPMASRTTSLKRSRAQHSCIPTSLPAPPGKTGAHGAAQWAVAWTADADGFLNSYCNTIPTPDGGTHESGLRAALTRGLKDHAERIGQGKRAAAITGDDVMTGAGAMLSVFIREPEFQGQTKDRLADRRSAADRRAGDQGPIRSLARRQPDAGQQAPRLRGRARRGAHSPPPGEGHRAQDRGAQAAATRQTRRLHQQRGRGLGTFHRRGQFRRRLSQAGARPRSQAVLPLRGKILNVASAGKDKLAQNQQLADLVQALGCGTGSHYRNEDLRYGRVIIMTDADVDGAHIASLLITFFYREMRAADR